MDKAMDKTKFHPLFERVVVRRIEEDARTEGGLEIPATQREKPQRGVIVAVCEPSEEMNCDPCGKFLHVGTQVLSGKFAGVEQMLDGEECVILHYREILGFFE